MAGTNCSNDKYLKNGRCCDRCPAGKYVLTDCDDTKSTQCAECKEGHYTATKNNVNRCQVCTVCSSDNNQRKLKDCTAKENTVCQCIPGFYCNNDRCDHCIQVTVCPMGAGVKVPATRTNNTVCAECKEGTYSNVTDFLSPCKPHTRCEDFGRVLKIPGNREADAVCREHYCSWMLPAGLWAGLVLTVLILFAVVICRKAKRRSYRADLFAPATVVPIAPATSLDLPLPVTSLDVPLPSTKLNGHCQESCTMDDLKLSLFNQDDNLVSCSMDSSLPITPLKVSVSFAEPSNIKGSSGYINFLRTHSEPQEDEWCGT